MKSCDYLLIFVAVVLLLVYICLRTPRKYPSPPVKQHYSELTRVLPSDNRLPPLIMRGARDYSLYAPNQYGMPQDVLPVPGSLSGPACYQFYEPRLKSKCTLSSNPQECTMQKEMELHELCYSRT